MHVRSFTHVVCKLQVRPDRRYPHVPALAYLRAEGGVVGSAPPLLGAARAPQGFLAEPGFTPAAAGAATGLMLVPEDKRRTRA